MADEDTIEFYPLDDGPPWLVNREDSDLIEFPTKPSK